MEEGHSLTHSSNLENLPSIITGQALCWMLLCVCCRHLMAKLCLTLSDPRDCSPPGSSVHGISQERILEWVAISSSRGFF